METTDYPHATTQTSINATVVTDCVQRVSIPVVEIATHLQFINVTQTENCVLQVSNLVDQHATHQTNTPATITRSTLDVSKVHALATNAVHLMECAITQITTVCFFLSLVYTNWCCLVY